jgi:tRNA A-37 threonylcarbamoyl transferase component Bud32
VPKLRAVTDITETALRNLDDLVTDTEPIAVVAYGPRIFAKPGASQGEDLLVLCEGYANGLRAHRRVFNGYEVRFLIVDRTLAESDLEKGTLGDYLTEQFLYPYTAIMNPDYIDALAFKAKERVVKEEARDLVLEFGEMCRGLVATPEFFGLSRMRKLARVFVPSLASYLRLLEEPVRGPNLVSLRQSFKAAVTAIGDGMLVLDGDYVALNDAVVDRWLKDRVSEQVVNVFRQSQRAFYSYLTKGRALYLSPELLARELISPLKLALDQELDQMKPEDPRNFLFLRTAEGLVHFTEKMSLDEVIKSLKLSGPVTITPLAGVLNEVSLVTAGKEQLVIKKFTDWHGFKWFALNLVSIGSKLFSVSGRARMTNEYGMNRYLAKRGVNVPTIVYLSVKQKILVERYLKGSPLSESVKEAVNQQNLTGSQSELIESMGETLARVHGVGVSIGDSKPENFLIEDGKIFIVDLEQAAKRADYAWDIAELLFYIGHYCIRPVPPPALKQLVEAFVKGYARIGDTEELRKAAAVKHAKTFSIWTAPPVILEISRVLHSAK